MQLLVGVYDEVKDTYKITVCNYKQYKRLEEIYKYVEILDNSGDEYVSIDQLLSNNSGLEMNIIKKEEN